MMESSGVNSFHRVEYKPDACYSMLENMINVSQVMRPDWWKVLPKSDQEMIFISGVVNRLLSCFSALLPQVKHEDYTDEKEWRICLQSYPLKGKPAPLPDKHFFSEGNANSAPPFCKIVHPEIPRSELLQFDYSDIEKIFVGPRLDFELAELAIKNILREYPNDDKVDSIPIRRARNGHTSNSANSNLSPLFRV